MSLFLLIVALLAGVLLVEAARLVARGADELIRRESPDPRQSPADYGLPYVEVWFLSRDGLRLHGWFIPAQGSPLRSRDDPQWSMGNRGVVIFCHGRFGSKDPDLKYVPDFHAAGYGVLLFDFRGHGRSEGRYSSFGYYERGDLQAAIDLLESKGIRRVGVLGFSLGGAVGISTAAIDPRIVGVVSDGGYAELSKVVRAGSVERGYPPWLSKAFAPLVLWWAKRRMGCRLEEADPIRWVARIAPRPLFLIHGEIDPYITSDDVRRLFAAAGEPKELWIAPGAGHRRVEERYPVEYGQRVLGFFDRYLGSAGGLYKQAMPAEGEHEAAAPL